MLNAFPARLLRFREDDAANVIAASKKSILPLQVDNVSLIKNEQSLLDRISFKLTGKGITVILGANGAGKTLLLKSCHGLLQPSLGKIEWREKDAVQVRWKQAMVFQRTVLLKRSVAANIDYALKLHGVPRKERSRTMDEVLNLTGLQHLKQRHARVLSGGEQQRLALARAWAVQPEVLFLDEPTASIDPSATAAVERLIRTFAGKGVKIVMTTHDLNQAKRLADEVLFLHQGRLLEQEVAKKFFECPKSLVANAFIHGELLW